MFRPDSAVLAEDQDGYVLRMKYASEVYDKIYLGEASEAPSASPDEYIEKDAENVFSIPVSRGNEEGTFRIASHSERKSGWYNRDLTLSAEASTLHINAKVDDELYPDEAEEAGDPFVKTDLEGFSIDPYSCTIDIHNDASMDISFTASSAIAGVSFSKIALTGQESAYDDKERAAAAGTKTGSGYRFTLRRLPVEYLGNARKIPFSLYKAAGSKGAWHDFSDQPYITFRNTPYVAGKLIDAIYVQSRYIGTDRLCAQAKISWDELAPDEQAEVSGTNAGPDYFGLDTGSCAEEDTRNGDDIGEKELLAVSFGTSYNESRIKDIGGIERALEEAYPDYSVRRAFTSQIIINHIQAREGRMIDNMEEALERAVMNHVKTLVVQPTHLMHGTEYDDMAEAVREYEDSFESVRIAEPMLGEVGASGIVVNADKKAVMEDLTSETLAVAGYKSLSEAEKDGMAVVLVGHGTSHDAQITYTQMQSQADELGYNNVFVGTVEGRPDGTSCGDIIDKIGHSYSKAVIRPMMVVAGDHAHNDMDGDGADSWKSRMKAAGIDTVVQTIGMGRIKSIEDLYIQHTADVMTE